MGWFVCGGIIGLVGGIVSALWYLPRSGRQLREQAVETAEKAGRALQARVEAAAPTDPVAESIAQGKAAARQRMRELGLDGDR
jgi:gas vesicle protein